MSRPICFVIMPYGVKETQARIGSTAPAKVDFDHLWNVALQPAVEGLGYDAVRADFDLGGMIIQEMLQRLALCDLVIADISISNVNVYYEVGIRHAAVAHGCVLVAADWAAVPFDLNQVRQLRYKLPAEKIDGDAAAEIIEIFKARVPKLASGGSPFHAAVPGFPNTPDRARMSAFQTKLSELAEFQSAVRAARASEPETAKARALELRNRHVTGAPLQESVALELLHLFRDCTDPQTTLEYIDRLPERTRNLPLVQEQRALVQSHSGNPLEAIGALEQLISLSGDTSERRGLIGGRYKRLWKAAADRALKAKYLDLAIKNYEMGMYLDLNDFYPTCNLPILYGARNRRGDDARAAVAAAVTEVACERARKRGSTDEWLKPTLLVAAFFAGDVEKAEELADEVRTEGRVAWKLDSVLADLDVAIAIARHERADELRLILEQLKQT